jgi:poly-gamma-glutamate capsule biosynthesis protein CapA/YwtB (metallophosphatase superfamily)
VVVITTAAGTKVGIWAAARHLPELATRKKPGIEPATRKRAQEALFAMHLEGASTMVAFLHAGLERTNRPDPDDVELMDDLAQMGFHIVTACHSHRIAGHKCVHREDGSNAFCFYGLGSISSGVIYSEREREGIIVVAGLDEMGKVVRVDVVPVHLEETGWGRVAQANDAYTTLNRFEALSEEIAQGSYKERFYGDVKTGLLQRQLRDVKRALQNGGVRGLLFKLSRMRMRHLNRALRNGIG